MRRNLNKVISIIFLEHSPMKLTLTNLERDEIITFKSAGQYPARAGTTNLKRAFLRRANKFHYSATTHTLKFILGPDRHVKFFTEEESEFKKDYIRLIHVTHGHAGRDRLYSILITKAYGLKRDEIMVILNECEICQARRALVTRPVIRPIIANHPRERYIADLIDFRYYSEINNDYKWMLVVVDSFSKFIWTTPLKEKSAAMVVPAIKTLFVTNGPSYLLHTDNGREFVNDSMRVLLEEFEVRHVRGRARCP